MAEKKVIELEVKNNLGTLKQQLKEAKAEVQSLTQEFGATSIETAKAAERASELKFEIAEGNKLIKAFDPTKSLVSVNGALGGVQESIGLVGTSISILGSESETASKAMEKVGLAMELTSGISSIGESVASFKTLGAVIKSTSVFQGIYNFVQTGSVKSTTQSAIAKVADTEATIAQGTATIATTTATTTATSGMKLLRIAIASTGVGLLVVGLGLLIQNFDYLKEKFNSLGTGAKVLLSFIFPIVGVFYAISSAYNYFAEDSIKANAKAESAIKKNTLALKEQVRGSERASEALKTKNGHEYDMAKASGASTKALRALALKHAEEEIALEKSTLATAKNTYEKNVNTLALYRNAGVSDELIAKQSDLVTKSREAVTKERGQLEDAYKNKQEIIRNNEVEIRQELTDSRGKIKESNKTHNEEIKKQNEEKAKAELDRIKKLKEDIASLEEEARVSKLSEESKELDSLDKKYDKIIEDAKKQSLDVTKLEEDKRLAKIVITDKYDAIEKAKQDEIDLKNAEIEKTKKEKLAEEKAFLQEITLEEDDLKLAKLTTQYEADQLLYKDNKEILKALDIKYDKDKQDLENAELARKRENTKKGIGMAMSALSVINDAIQAGAGKSEKDQRRAFKAQKAFNLASAITNTYLAVTGALTAGGNPLKLATGAQFVEAGIAGALGAVQIAKIAKTQFEGGASADTNGGGGGGGGGVTAPTMSAPQFNVVGQSGVNQLASLGQQPIQAYVVSGQVTSQQSLDRNRLANATLGG